MRRPLFAAALILALAPAAASAQTYPNPKEPGPVAKPPKGPHHTYTVCAKGCDYKVIQKAVDKAKAGDTVRVKNGTYREAVNVAGSKKSYLKIVGNASKPEKVLLKAKGKMQNAFHVDGADEVTIEGFKAQDFKANGFFFTNLNGYTMNHLIAQHDGVYGLYAFNTIGGTIENSEAYYHNDAGFYIGQTPPQSNPITSMVKNVDSWGNTLGFSATNMRYVTITKSRFYNNALGIVPNALDTEKYPPAESNTIIDNDIFWNNFNVHTGNPPFKVRADGVPALAPVGTGVLLLGGRTNRVENNRIYGNFLAGVAAAEDILIDNTPAARALSGNIIQNNQFGLNGTDINGFDYAYDGNGTNNCFSMAGVTSTFPADQSTYAGCGGTNAFSQTTQNTMIGWTGVAALSAWKKHDHPAKPGYTPLEVFQ